MVKRNAPILSSFHINVTPARSVIIKLYLSISLCVGNQAIDLDKYLCQIIYFCGLLITFCCVFYAVTCALVIFTYALVILAYTLVALKLVMLTYTLVMITYKLVFLTCTLLTLKLVILTNKLVTLQLVMFTYKLVILTYTLVKLKLVMLTYTCEINTRLTLGYAIANSIAFIIMTFASLISSCVLVTLFHLLLTLTCLLVMLTYTLVNMTYVSVKLNFKLNVERALVSYVLRCNVDISARESYVLFDAAFLYPLFSSTDLFTINSKLRRLSLKFVFSFKLKINLIRIFIINFSISLRLYSIIASVASMNRYRKIEMKCVQSKKRIERNFVEYSNERGIGENCGALKLRSTVNERLFDAERLFNRQFNPIVISVEICHVTVIFYCYYYNFIINIVIPMIAFMFLYTSVISMPFYISYPIGYNLRFLLFLFIEYFVDCLFIFNIVAKRCFIL